MTDYFSAAVLQRRKSYVSREQGPYGKYGAEDDRVESVNQSGPWWPERTAGLPELMVRWREHRYLSHYHSRWWTRASLKTPHPWQMKNSPFVNGALRESSEWVQVRFGFESWCFSASMAVFTGGRCKVAIFYLGIHLLPLIGYMMQRWLEQHRSCMPTHPDETTTLHFPCIQYSPESALVLYLKGESLWMHRDE